MHVSVAYILSVYTRVNVRAYILLRVQWHAALHCTCTVRQGAHNGD